jgi:hypothetical protein
VLLELIEIVIARKDRDLSGQAAKAARSPRAGVGPGIQHRRAGSQIRRKLQREINLTNFSASASSPPPTVGPRRSGRHGHAVDINVVGSERQRVTLRISQFSRGICRKSGSMSKQLLSASNIEHDGLRRENLRLAGDAAYSPARAGQAADADPKKPDISFS